MKRAVPVAIASGVGIIILLTSFVDGSDVLLSARDLILRWVTILGAFALILGIANVLRVHVRRIIKAEPGWIYSFVLLAVMLFVIVMGVLPGGGGLMNPFVDWTFTYVFLPLNATIFSLLAFFVASAAYRTFRLRSSEATVMVVAGLIVLVGQVPLGGLVPGLSAFSGWLLDTPVMAAVRGILLGVALGTITAGLRLIGGADKQYLE
ncbi:MAG: hypothetical protein HYX94_11700 [Chloroflexi bacterium]|nr:hypothetical protein [Chloroflexota bacterium]